jgi:RES domain-containing protein
MVARPAMDPLISSLGLLVPSVIASEERNLLLNPAHPRFREARVVRKSRVRLDMRLYEKARR